MKNISMIACVGKNLELGKKNDLIFHLPEDMQYFRKTTTGKTVVMGYNTYLSLPGLLPKRKNIILYLEKIDIPGAEVYTSIEDVLKLDEDMFIIGGGSIYKQFLPYADKLYLTEVNKGDKEATVYFPKFDKRKYKKTIIEEHEKDDLKYNFVLYERR